MTRNEQVERLIQELSSRIRESLTLEQQGRRREAIALWHQVIVQIFVNLWFLVSRHEEELQKAS